MNVGYRELVDLLELGGQLVEVLPAAEYREGHIPGAINLPLKALHVESADHVLDRTRPIAVYCHDGL